MRISEMTPEELDRAIHIEMMGGGKIKVPFLCHRHRLWHNGEAIPCYSSDIRLADLVASVLCIGTNGWYSLITSAEFRKDELFRPLEMVWGAGVHSHSHWSMISHKHKSKPTAICQACLHFARQYVKDEGDFTDFNDAYDSVMQTCKEGGLIR